MKKLDIHKPVYSQIYDLLSVGEGPWEIQAYNTKHIRNAQAVTCQIGRRLGTRYTTRSNGLTLTIKKVSSTPLPFPVAKVAFDAPLDLAKDAKVSLLEVLDQEIEKRTKNVEELTQSLAAEKSGLKALLVFKEKAPF